MNRESVHHAAGWLWRHKLPLGFCLLPMAMLGFLVVEHARGALSLASYLRTLRAQGEKMAASDFKQPPPPGENGAPEVLAAAKELKPGTVLPKSYPPRMQLTPAGHAVVCFREDQWVEPKVTNNWEQLAADLEENDDTLERIRIAMTKPVLDCGIDPGLGPMALFPNLPVPKELTHWFGSRIALGLHRAKARETVQDLVTEIDLPRLLARDGIVISELVRDAISAIARTDTWEALQADGWTDDDLARIQDAWEKQEFAAPMVRALEGERIFAQSSYILMRNSNQETANILFTMQDYLQLEEHPAWERSISDLPGGPEVADFLKKQVYCRLWRFAWLDQDQVHYLQYLQQLIALGRQMLREKSLQKLQPAVDELMLKSQPRGIYNQLRYPSVTSVESLSRVFARAMRAETERSLVLAAIALKRCILRHGHAPESLNALVEFLPSLPVDYMDGQPLRFRPLPDGGFLLYSVGEDGHDDGGDTSLPPGKTNPRLIWERKDVVWPAPASEDEIEHYRAQSAKN